MAKVWLAVEVDVPAGFDVDELPGYLNKFVEIGLADLHDSCLDRKSTRLNSSHT